MHLPTFALAMIVSMFVPALVHDQQPTHAATSYRTGINIDERVYWPNEVDKVADVKNLYEVLKEFQSSLNCTVEEILTLKIVLHKSGKVTDVKVETTQGCKIPDGAVAVFQKTVFTTAVKNGIPVSQLLEIRVETGAVAP